MPGARPGERRLLLVRDSGAAHAVTRHAGRVVQRVSAKDPDRVAGLAADPTRFDGVVLDTGDEAANLQLARQVAERCVSADRQPPGFDIVVVVERWTGYARVVALDSDLDNRSIRVRPYSASARRARTALSRCPWSRLTWPAAASAIVAGTGALAEHLVIELFRSMHLAGQRPQVVVIGRAAETWVAAMHGQLPQLTQIGTLTALDRAGECANPCAAYVVDAANGARLEDLPGFVPVYWFPEDPPPSTAFVIAPPAPAAGAYDMTDDPLDVRARAIHEYYFEQALRDGDAPGCRPSMQDWTLLPERYRLASRYQADHVPIKLAMIGCRETANPDDTVRFTSDEVERLAEVEHRRWSAVQLLDGWRYAPTRDDRARTTPYLRPFAQLPTEIQDRDRMPVRQMPAQLARIGHGVRRNLVIRLSGDPAAAPGVGFAWGLAGLLRTIARHYPDRQPVLYTYLASPAERRAVGIVLKRQLALVTLLLDGDTDRVLDGLADYPDAVRQVVAKGQGPGPCAGLYLHIGRQAPAARRVVLLSVNGRVERAPWL